MGPACPRVARHSPDWQHGHSCAGVHPGWVIYEALPCHFATARNISHRSKCLAKGLAVLLVVHECAGPSKLYTASSTALAWGSDTPACTLTCSQAAQWCGDHSGQLLRGVHISTADLSTRTAVVRHACSLEPVHTAIVHVWASFFT